MYVEACAVCGFRHPLGVLESLFHGKCRAIVSLESYQSISKMDIFFLKLRSHYVALSGLALNHRDMSLPQPLEFWD